VPWMAVLYPEFPASMSRRLTIGTGLDALSHSIEALVSNTASGFTDALAVKSVEIVMRYLPVAVKDPSSLEAREKMHLAAMMAGMSFSNSGLGLAHAIAHTVGPMLKAHHGAIVATVLPYVVRYNAEKSDLAAEKYGYLEKVLNAVLDGEVSLLDRLISLYRDVEHPLTLAEYGGSHEWLRRNENEIIEGVFSDPDLGFNPVLPSEDDILELIKRAIRGLL